MTAVSVDLTALLNGFTVTAGNADASAGDDSHGGGMTILTGSRAVLRNRFIANRARDGGAMYTSASGPGNAMPSIVDCYLTGNLALDDGGGMYNAFKGQPTLVNCVLTGN